jgi:battenin
MPGTLSSNTRLFHHSVNVFYRINHEPPDNAIRYNDIELTRQAREFKIGSIGFADSTGILLASILAVPTEIELCRAQVSRGKMLCKSL